MRSVRSHAQSLTLTGSIFSLTEPIASPTISGTLTLPSTTTLVRGNQSPVAGGAMKIDNLMETSPDFPLVNEGAIWPGSMTYSYLGVSKEFTSGSVATPGTAPLTPFFSFANNKGSGSSVAAIMGDTAWAPGYSYKPNWRMNVWCE